MINQKNKKSRLMMEHQAFTGFNLINYQNYLNVLLESGKRLGRLMVEQLPHKQWPSPAFWVRFPARAPTIPENLKCLKEIN